MTTAREGKQFRKRVGKGTAAMNIRNFLDYGQDTRFRLTIFSSGTDFACEPRTSTNHIQSSPSCDPASLIFKPLPSCASGSVPIADLQHNAPLIVYPIRPLPTRHARLGRTSTFQLFTLPPQPYSNASSYRQLNEQPVKNW